MATHLRRRIPLTIQTDEDIRLLWVEFKEHLMNKAEYAKENHNRFLNGAGKFVDFLCGIESPKNTAYAQSTEKDWPSK